MCVFLVLWFGFAALYIASLVDLICLISVATASWNRFPALLNTNSGLSIFTHVLFFCSAFFF